MALDVPYRSIPDMFRRRVAATPDRDALGHPTPDEGIAWLTWTQADKRVTAIAAGLIGLGVAPGDRVAILCGTRVEWILADFGINCAGAATTAIYPTTEPDEAVFIVRDSGSKVLIAENAAYWIDEFHLDGLRLDATQSIDDPSLIGEIVPLCAK